MMDLYSCLMGIDEVIEYLNNKTDRVFNQDKAIKLIEEKNIPIVFKYRGWGTYEFNYEGEYQSLNVEVNGYFNFQNDKSAIEAFKDSSKEITLHEAMIYQLDSLRIRGNAPKEIELKGGDYIAFKTGGRSPLFSSSNTQNFIKIDSNQVGVLKEDLEEYLNKVQIETMNDKAKIEALKFRVENLETEKATLLEKIIQTKEKSTAENNELDIESMDKDVSARSQDRKLIAMMAILLAHKLKIFRVGDRPNATQINEAIFNLAQRDLGVIDDDMFGLKGNVSKISSAINEYSHIIKNKPKE